MTIRNVEVGRTYLPDGYREPRTVASAILAARGLLEEEGRWAQGSWFENPARLADPETYDDNPYCNSWQACMMGAVRIVTVGLAKKQWGSYKPSSVWTFSFGGVDNEPRHDDMTELYKRTEAFLDSEAKRRGAIDGVHFNDCIAETRDDVLSFLQESANRAFQLDL